MALKIVPNNPKYKNREVDILKSLKHPNIVSLLRYYENTDEAKRVNCLLFLEILLKYSDGIHPFNAFQFHQAKRGQEEQKRCEENHFV